MTTKHPHSVIYVYIVVTYIHINIACDLYNIMFVGFPKHIDIYTDFHASNCSYKSVIYRMMFVLVFRDLRV